MDHANKSTIFNTETLSKFNYYPLSERYVLDNSIYDICIAKNGRIK